MAANKPMVVVLEPGYRDYETERSILSTVGAEVASVPVDQDAEAAMEALDPAVILVRDRPVPAAVIAAAPNLRAVIRYGVGVDNVDLDAASARRIFVANLPDYGAEEVSDHAFALYLAVSRRIVSRDRQVRQGQWDIGQAEPVYSARGRTLGLVGFGRIARRVLEKFRALGFAEAVVADPFLDARTAAQHGVEVVELDALCRQSDAISLHVPLTESTRNLIDARRIGLMKPTAVLINTARGGLIDESALAEALHDGRIFGAGLDVFAAEPLPPDSPLLDCPNLVVTDHMAWYSESSVEELQRKAAEEAVRVLRGELPHNWVNPWSEAAAS